MQLINTKPMIKNKLKEFLSKLKKFKVQAILVLEYKTCCIMNTEQTSKNIRIKIEMIVKSSIQALN